MDASQGLIRARRASRRTPPPAPRSSTPGSSDTGWMPRVHPAEAVARHYREHVFATCRMLVAEREGAIAGYLALDGEGYVAGLYVAEAARGRGVGTALVEAAKALRPEGLTLWTFVANAGARRFYARHGFVEAGRHDGRERGGAAGHPLRVEGAAVTRRGDALPVLTVVLGDRRAVVCLRGDPERALGP